MIMITFDNVRLEWIPNPSRYPDNSLPQGNNMAANRERINVNEHIEFVVKAAEDLILEGKERSLVRVRAETLYSCLMLKNQRFSSLFRHYAKHHGLRKEDLTYSFTEPLQDEDTPESIFLQPRDEVIVRKRRSFESTIDNIESCNDDDGRTLSNEKYIIQIASLLDGFSAYFDVTFYCGQSLTPVRAHKMILIARSEYFRNMFRRNSLKEGSSCEVKVESHDELTVRCMLEFIYCNRVCELHRCGAEQIYAMLSISEEYMLTDLKKQCELTARGIITSSNVGRLLSAAEQFRAVTLKKACLVFVQKNMNECTHNQAFCNEMYSAPKLCISILKHISKDGKLTTTDVSSSYGNSLQITRCKRRRVDIEVDLYEDRRGPY